MQIFTLFTLLALSVFANGLDVVHAGGAEVAVNQIRDSDFNVVNGKVEANSKKGLSCAPTRADLPGGGKKKTYLRFASLRNAGFTVVQDKPTHIKVSVEKGSPVAGQATEAVRTLLNSHFTRLPDMKRPVSEPEVEDSKPSIATDLQSTPELLKKRFPYGFDREKENEKVIIG